MSEIDLGMESTSYALHLEEIKKEKAIKERFKYSFMKDDYCSIFCSSYNTCELKREDRTVGANDSSGYRKRYFKRCSH